MDFFGVILDGSSNPLLFGVFFFIYVVLNTLALPFPVELGLFNPAFHPLFLIGILALGRGVGAFFVFEIGGFIRKKTSNWSIGAFRLRKIINSLERFIQQYGYYALFLLMSIPLMLDSVVLYLFSLLNKRKDTKTALARRWFIGITIAASILRGTIILLVAEFVKIILIN
jgi:hypothetical protein